MVIAIIAIVLAASALIGVMAWRFIHSVEALQANPAKLRRRLTVMAAIYCLGILFAIAKVLDGEAPAYSLFCLPIGLFFVWNYLRAAARLKKGPK